MSSAPLAGQVVAVTGSSSGIGAATARAFAAPGAAVLVNSSQSVDEGEAVAASLPDARYVQGDITDPAFPDRLVAAALERWGRLDTLVNNAGTTAVIPHHDVAAASVDVWRRIFEVNVFGTWAMTVAALPALREAARLRGQRRPRWPACGPTGSSIPYAASKAALNHMTELLAKVVGPEVRVNAVAPGLIDTPWTEDWDVVREVVGQAGAAEALGPARGRGRGDPGAGGRRLRDGTGRGRRRRPVPGHLSRAQPGGVDDPAHARRTAPA